MEFEAVDEGRSARSWFPTAPQGVKVNAADRRAAGRGRNASARGVEHRRSGPDDAKAAATAAGPAAATPLRHAPSLPPRTPRIGSRWRGERDLRLAAGAPHRQGPASISAASPAQRAAWPHCPGRCREGQAGRGAPAPSGCRRARSDGTDPAAYREVSAQHMRKVIARRLTEAKQTDSAFLPDGRLQSRRASGAARPRSMQRAGAEDDYKLSVNDFVIKACAPGADEGAGGQCVLHRDGDPAATTTSMSRVAVAIAAA